MGRTDKYPKVPDELGVKFYDIQGKEPHKICEQAVMAQPSVDVGGIEPYLISNGRSYKGDIEIAPLEPKPSPMMRTRSWKQDCYLPQLTKLGSALKLSAGTRLSAKNGFCKDCKCCSVSLCIVRNVLSFKIVTSSASMK